MKSSSSIVLFNHSYKEIFKVVNSILKFTNSDFRIYLIDNSPVQNLSSLQKISEKIIYIHNPTNPGFGAAHNLALNKAINDNSQFHFVINPDVAFDEDVLTPMIEYIKDNSDVGMMMPQILNEDGSIQNLPKLLPSPYSVLMRKWKKPVSIYNKFINDYELRFVNKKRIYNAPILSGCFTLLRLKAIKEIGMYDDRFFMYFEDWDLSRRMHIKYKTIYFPQVSVIHGYESGANKNSKLFKIFIRSTISYFNKWGWFFDRNRTKVNKETLLQFR